MKIIRLSGVLMLLTMLFFFAGCRADDDPTEDITYDAVVLNSTAVDVDIYLNNETSSSGYKSEGTIPAGEELIIADLLVGVTYTLRASATGEVVEGYFFEESIMNSTNTNVEIEITM